MWEVLRTLIRRILARMLPPLPPPCPSCRDDRLVEWDGVLQKFVCNCCAHQWRVTEEIAPRVPSA